jgi:cytochrome c oxidase cbb3-type subunit IV
MLKYIKHHMATMEGVEVYPLIALAIFFLIFLYYAFWAVKADRSYISHLSDLPLDQNKSDQ